MLADELVLTHRLFNLGFQQNIMTFMLGWYMMHQLKGISQLLNIVYVKHTKKEKKASTLYWTWCVPLLKKLHISKTTLVWRPSGGDISYKRSMERTSHKLVGEVLWDIGIMERAYEIFENVEHFSTITYSRIVFKINYGA